MDDPEVLPTALRQKPWKATGRVWVCCMGTREPTEALGEDETIRALFQAGVWGFWLQLDLSLLPAGLLSSIAGLCTPSQPAQPKPSPESSPAKMIYTWELNIAPLPPVALAGFRT